MLSDRHLHSLFIFAMNLGISKPLLFQLFLCFVFSSLSGIPIIHIIHLLNDPTVLRYFVVVGFLFLIFFLFACCIGLYLYWFLRATVRNFLQTWWLQTTELFCSLFLGPKLRCQHDCILSEGSKKEYFLSPPASGGCS